MGLDGVELIMETEDVFGIRIEDEEAEVCLHPRDVIELIWSKVSHSEKAVCPSQRAFYITRRALVHAFGADRNAVKPDSLVSEFIPRDNQPESWALLREIMEVESLPRLVFPTWMTAMGTLIVLGAFIAVVWVAVAKGVPTLGWLSVPVAIALCFILGLAANPWRTRIPVYNKPVTQLSRFAYSSERMEWTKEGVAEAFKAIVMEVLGVSEEQYSEDAHFVKDYGV